MIIFVSKKHFSLTLSIILQGLVRKRIFPFIFNYRDQRNNIPLYSSFAHLDHQLKQSFMEEELDSVNLFKASLPPAAAAGEGEPLEVFCEGKPSGSIISAPLYFPKIG